jgi:hypothetical protein
MPRFKRASALFLATTTLLLAAAVPVLADWANQNGGLQDLSTGLVWSRSQAHETGSWWSWDRAVTNAANYSVTDGSGTYSDWRMPTVSELKTAIINGTLTEVSLRDGHQPHDGRVWSSEKRGNKGWAVYAVRDDSGQVIDARAELHLKGSGFEVHFVRP